MNITRLPAFAACLTIALVIGCSREDSSEDGHKKAPASAHGVSGAAPGSYEDWCAEHSVPESACTRCDASLAAAFKATGDWCAEHGLPESQCVQCDPSRKMVRPPKPEDK